MKEPDKLLSGLKLIESLDLTEIDERIAWLEAELHAWRTLKVVRSAISSLPSIKRSAPSSTDAPKPAWGQGKERLLQIIREHPTGIHVTEAARQAGLARQTVDAYLRDDPAYVHVGKGRWTLTENEQQARYAEEYPEPTDVRT